MTDNRTRRASRYMLAGVAVAAILAAPTVGSAATANGTFGVQAVNEEKPSITAVRGIDPSAVNEGSNPGGGGSGGDSGEATGPTTPPVAKDDLTTMTVNSSLPGCTASTFNLSLSGGDTSNPGVSTPVDTEVSWGDGSATEKLSYFGSHSYSSGTYQLKIKGTFGGFGTDFSGKCIQSVDHFGADSGIRTLESMFSGAQGIQSVAAPPATVTNTARMFKDSSFNGSTSGWSLPRLINAESMFDGAASFSGGLRNFAPGGTLTNAGYIFRNASSFDGDVSGWNTSKVKSFYMSFNGATAFTGTGIGDWKTDSATTMSQMFFGAKNFSGEIGSWNTGNVTDMTSMFSNATRFNGNIGSWDVSEVQSFRAMFYRATSFNQDLTRWSVADGADGGNFSLESGLSDSKLPAKLRGA